MQQWEYRTARLTNAAFRKLKGWQLMEINEQELPDWQDTEPYPSMVAFFNQMGLQGWELVCEMRYFSVLLHGCYILRVEPK